jgi:NAD(P)-dependent dehydrogenase (short-subunit alcohol dehydrogenase family)
MALEQFKLDGQVAIVTGAGRGVGSGIAKVLSEAGATVVGTARGDSELKETIAQIQKAGGTALGLTGDVTKRADNDRVVKTTMERFGRIDILINNAGGADYAPFLEITDEAFRHHFEWNTTSAFIMSQLVAPHMLRAGSGSIVNISSGAGRFGIRGLLAYCVAKGALNQLTKGMAQELAPKVRVNAIALGSFMTAALQKTFDMMPQAEAGMRQKTPLHRFGDVADLGRLVVYLCSRDCYATNAIFDVDGGIDATNSPIDVPDL